MASQYFSLRGKVYIGDRDKDGNPDGLTHVGNVPDCTLSLTVETMEHKESMSGQDLTDLSIITAKSGELSLTTEELLKEVFGYILNGTVTDEASGEVKDDAPETLCTKPAVGKNYPLAHQDVSDVKLSYVDAGDTPGTPVEIPIGTEGSEVYEVNALHGSIVFKDTGDFAEKKILAEYKYGAVRHVSMFTSDVTDKWFRLEGINKITNDRVIVELYKIAINPTDGLAFISDELGSAPITAKVLADTQKSADGLLGQFGRIIIIPAKTATP